MSGFMDKMSNIFFKTVEDDEDEMEMESPMQNRGIERPTLPMTSSKASARDPRDIWGEPEPKKNKKSNLMSIPTQNKVLDMVLVKAESYDDMQTIAQHIKEERVVIVNFEDMSKDVAQRMVDFLSGAVFALDGVPKKVSGGTFLFSSRNVDLTGKIMDGEQEFSSAFNFGSNLKNESKGFKW
ncbi:MAG: cell division protein SepF [Peptococcaceae bacterium]|nr:cell division protein SepF [Peptococcaceae bacterium]